MAFALGRRARCMASWYAVSLVHVDDRLKEVKKMLRATRN
jgi:hypothetical protein